MTQLRLRGVMPLQLLVAAVCAYPLAFLVWLRVYRQHFSDLTLMVVAGALALLPWLSRAGARALYRAAFDDVAVHVRGEALPYRTITSAALHIGWRRHVLVLTRGDTVSVELLLWDAFAGRLEPWAPLRAHLRAHGHEVPA